MSSKPSSWRAEHRAFCAQAPTAAGITARGLEDREAFVAGLKGLAEHFELFDDRSDAQGTLEPAILLDRLAAAAAAASARISAVKPLDQRVDLHEPARREAPRPRNVFAFCPHGLPKTDRMPMLMAEKIVKRRVEELMPYVRNARTHSDEQIAQIAGSIREFGFTNPLLLDGANGILAGHGRLLGARKLGMTEVPCIEFAHLTPAQRRAYIIADNKLALNAGWDTELLKLELEDLKLSGFDLSLTGFGEPEIDALMVEKTEGLTDPDEVPDTPAQPVSRPGDLWLLGANVTCPNCHTPTPLERAVRK